jgi:hypothetical protein
MNDDLMFDYLLQMGQMQPEQAELKRKQAMVDALRKNSMAPMEGQMVGKHYVSPGLAGAVSQLGQAYFAGQGQKGVDAQVKDMNASQAKALEEMRRRRMMGGVAAQPTEQYSDPDQQFLIQR